MVYYVLGTYRARAGARIKAPALWEHSLPVLYWYAKHIAGAA